MAETDKYEALRLENQLCFPLYACSRQLIKLYTPHLKKIGLTYTQYITLLVLWVRKEVTVRELSETLYLDTGTMTPLLQRMERDGYIARKRNVRDERYIYVTLTDKGWSLQERALFIPDAVSGELDINTSDAKTLYITLYRILGNM